MVKFCGFMKSIGHGESAKCGNKLNGRLFICKECKMSQMKEWLYLVSDSIALNDWWDDEKVNDFRDFVLLLDEY